MTFMGDKQGEREMSVGLTGKREEEDQSKLNKKTWWLENQSSSVHYEARKREEEDQSNSNLQFGLKIGCTGKLLRRLQCLVGGCWK